MQPLSIPAGATMLLGPPAKPMPPERTEALTNLVANTEGILEAHLPQLFVVGVMDSAAQILVVSIAPSANQSQVLNSLSAGLKGIVPSNEFLDIWPVAPNSSMLKDVRNANCQILAPARQKPWWKFW
jgi:hypothetical protein